MNPLASSVFFPCATFARLIFAGCFALSGFCLFAATPRFEEHVVWEDREDEMLTYHVPTVFVSNRDTVLAAADARFQEYGDFGPHHVVVKRSTDGGRTWAANNYVARSDGKQIYLFPNFIQPRDSSRIYFFYSEKNVDNIHHLTHVWLRHSDDDGQTWSEPRDLAHLLVRRDAELKELIRSGSAGPEFKYENHVLYGRRAFFSGPGVAIQLSADHRVAPNRLIVPFLGMLDRWVSALQRAQFNTVLISDDGGVTWEAGGTVPIGDHQNSEPSIVELDNGDLLFNIRVENRGYRVLSRSTDGGRTWSVSEPDSTLPGFDQVHAGLLRMSLARNDPTGTSRMLISFPHGAPTQVFRNPYKRENMNVWLSYDNHRTWAVRKVINPGSSYYSNLAKLSDGTLLLIYGRDGNHRSMPARNVIARFNLEWLTDGRDSLTSGPIKE